MHSASTAGLYTLWMDNHFMEITALGSVDTSGTPSTSTWNFMSSRILTNLRCHTSSDAVLLRFTLKFMIDDWYGMSATSFPEASNSLVCNAPTHCHVVAQRHDVRRQVLVKKACFAHHVVVAAGVEFLETLAECPASGFGSCCFILAV